MADDDKTVDPPEDPADDPTDPPADDPDDDDGDDADPAKVKAERDRLRTLVGKIKVERTNLRKELKAAKDAGLPKETPPKAVDEAKAAVQKAEERAIRQAGVLALTSAGMSKEQAKKSVRLLDLEGVELDSDGDADLEDQVDDLRAQFPGLFPKGGKDGPKAPRINSSPSSASRTPAQPKRDATSEKLLRQAGYIR